MSPYSARSALRAWVMSENRSITELSSAYDLELLSEGRRVVFGFTDLENISVYARTFLEADKSLAMAPWKIQLHQPSRLPWISEPIIFPLSTSVSLHPGPDPESTQLGCLSRGDNAFLAVAAVNNLWIIDLDRWGEAGAIQLNPFNHAFQHLSSLRPAPEAGQYWLVDDGILFQVTYEGQCWNLDQQDLPRLGTTPSPLRAVYGFPPHHCLYRFEDGQLWRATAAGTSPLHFIDNNRLSLKVDDLEWLPDGSIVFTADSKTTLWHGRLQDPQANRILGPVNRPPIYFCVDQKGILYVVNSSNRRLQLLLPPNHWVCPVCGTHRPDRPPQCPYCHARTRPNAEPINTFCPWLDFDLSSLGGVMGPITVDQDLNIYLLVDLTRLVSISFSRQDLWGEQEN